MATEEIRDDYIVIRETVIPAVVTKGEPGRGEDQTVLEMETLHLSGNEAEEVREEDDVSAVARTFPVRLIEPVTVASATAPDTEGHTWGLDAIGALDSPFTGAGVKVAVLDTGIDADHEAFDGLRIQQANFTGESGDDLNGHGTHCAGTIFGRPVGGRRIGVAPGVSEALVAKVIPERGVGTTREVFDGLMWASRMGADIISMSLGLDFPGLLERLRIQYNDRDPRLLTQMALDEFTNTLRACDAIVQYIASTEPALLVAATGNESDRRSRPRVRLKAALPAAIPGIVAIGAVGHPSPGCPIAWFSNSEPDVVGPGVDVLSAAPGGGLVSRSGTSMATPHVAGVAALWAEQLGKTRGHYRATDLQQQLLANASWQGLVDSGRQEIGSGLVRAPG